MGKAELCYDSIGNLKKYVESILKKPSPFLIHYFLGTYNLC